MKEIPGGGERGGEALKRFHVEKSILFQPVYTGVVPLTASDGGHCRTSEWEAALGKPCSFPLLAAMRSVLLYATGWEKGFSTTSPQQYQRYTLCVSEHRDEPPSKPNVRSCNAGGTLRSCCCLRWWKAAHGSKKELLVWTGSGWWCCLRHELEAQELLRVPKALCSWWADLVSFWVLRQVILTSKAALTSMEGNTFQPVVFLKICHDTLNYNHLISFY